MPFFTAIGAAIASAAATTFTAASIGAFALKMAVGIGLSLLAQKIAGKKTEDPVGIQGTMQRGGDIARSFIVGRYNTAGSLVYANTWGQVGQTPNAILVQVIALSDLPSQSLDEIWVNGAKCDLVDSYPATQNLGKAVSQYRKNNQDYLWVRFLDGTQVSADPILTAWFGSDARPYGTDRVGTGITYAVVTSLQDTDKDSPLFTGIPTCKFTITGCKLYDPSRDSTVGGDGDQRWSDRSTWGGDGDHLPAVQIYNLLRGITYNGTWLYGLQNLPAARLPAADWIAAINKCRMLIDGPDGQEATYRSAAQIDISVALADTIEALLTSCQGKLTETGGVYKLRLGAPDAAVLEFSDGDILSSEEQTFTPFFGLSDTINGITAKYPEPAEGWNLKVAPPLYDEDYEAEDGGRRLLSDVTLAAVPYTGQVQRLMQSSLLEARRARRHTYSLPPWAQVLEPGDYVKYTSDRNGYEEKLFRVDGVADKANLDVLVDLTEVDPTDYDWNQDADYTEPVFAPMQLLRVPPQPIVDWFAEGAIYYDDTSRARRPAILLSWDGNKEDLDGVEFEVRDSALVVVHRGRTDNAAAGSIYISQGILPAQTYSARGRYIPSSPRTTEWSDWLSVTTPDVRFGVADLDDPTAARVTEEFNRISNQIDDANSRFDEVIPNIVAQISATQTDLRQQSWDHRVDLIDRIDLASGAASASIEEVRTIAVATDAALSEYKLTVTAQLGDITSSIETNATAISTLDSSFASYQVTVSSQFDSVTSSVTTNATAISNTNASLASLTSSVNARLGTAESNISTNATAIASVNSSLSSYEATTNATLGAHSTSITANATSVATINGYAASRYTLKLTTDNYVAGTELFNGGNGQSFFTISADVFRVAWPGVAGGSPVPIFQIANVNGSAKLAFRGDAFFDGFIQTRHLDTNSVTTDKLTVNSVTNLKTFTYGAKNWQSTSPLSGGVVSGTHDIQSGTATIEWCDNIYIDQTVNPNPIPVTVTFYINVDGTNYHTVSLRPYGTAAAWLRQDPISAKAVVTGLSQGNHTFSITGDHSGSGSTILLDGGIMTVLDLKR